MYLLVKILQRMIEVAACDGSESGHIACSAQGHVRSSLNFSNGIIDSSMHSSNWRGLVCLYMGDIESPACPAPSKKKCTVVTLITHHVTNSLVPYFADVSWITGGMCVAGGGG